MDSNLGKKARDKVTGFKGTITGSVQYLTGCAQYLLVASVGEGGGLVGSEWFDVQRVEILPGDAVVLDNAATPGADKAPLRRL